MENRKIGLPEAFFAQGLVHRSRQLLKAAEADLARGALDQASESLARGFKNNAQRLVVAPCPLLTEEENNEYLRLRRFKYVITPSGHTFIRRFASEGVENRFNFLASKASGVNK